MGNENPVQISCFPPDLVATSARTASIASPSGRSLTSRFRDKLSTSAEGVPAGRVFPGGAAKQTMPPGQVLGSMAIRPCWFSLALGYL